MIVSLFLCIESPPILPKIFLFIVLEHVQVSLEEFSSNWGVIQNQENRVMLWHHFFIAVTLKLCPIIVVASISYCQDIALNRRILPSDHHIFFVSTSLLDLFIPKYHKSLSQHHFILKLCLQTLET